MTSHPDRTHLNGPTPREDLRELHETRVPVSERDQVRESGFDAYSAPELQAASSMSGASRMQRIVALSCCWACSRRSGSRSSADARRSPLRPIEPSARSCVGRLPRP